MSHLHIPDGGAARLAGGSMVAGHGGVARPDLEVASEERRRGQAASVFVRLVLLLGAVGWILEAAITGLIAGHVANIRPDLMGLPVQGTRGR